MLALYLATVAVVKVLLPMLNIRDEPVDEAHPAGPHPVNLVDVQVVVAVVVFVVLVVVLPMLALYWTTFVVVCCYSFIADVKHS